MLHKLDNAALKWLDSAVFNGESLDHIFQLLRSKNFSDAAIAIAIAKCKTDYGWANGAPPPTDFQALANIALVRNSGKNGIKAVDIPGIQLYTIDDFLSAEECTQLAISARRTLAPSITGDNANHLRTSRTGLMATAKDAAAAKLEQKISATLGINSSYSEVLQGQLYEKGQYFHQHTDYFVPGTPIYEPFTLIRGNRTWTFMIYLNDVEQGGDTVFTRINYRIHPKMGRAVAWNNLLPDGNVNPLTIHTGESIEAGEKMIITHWFRERGKGS